MTSFDIATVTHEINEMVNGAHVAKIYQIGIKTLLIKLRIPNQPRVQLLIEAGKRMHLTSYAQETPKKPSAFCMSLRKYLDNGVVKEIRQYAFERITIIEINTRQGNYQLISELFGAGNIILVDPKGKILQAMTYKRMRDRNILRGEPFQHPPARGKNPTKLDKKDFREIKKLGKIEVVRGLTKFLSISGTYAEEILLRTEINKKRKCISLTEQEIDNIFNQLQNLLSLINKKSIEPRIIYNEKSEWIDVTPVPLRRYDQFNQKKYENFNSALDDYYTKITATERKEEITEEVESEVSRYKRILQKQQKALEDLKEPIRKNKAIGDIIYLHFGELGFLLQKIMEKKRNGKSWKEINSQMEKEKKTNSIPYIYFHSIEANNQVLYVSVENQLFSINLHLSIQANANNYYSQSKRAEKKLRGAEKTIKETRAKIEKAKQQVKQKQKTQQPLVKRRKKFWFEKFRWFHSSNGFLVIGGKEATTNEILIKKHMEPKDIVFHAEISGAPFVLIKTGGETPPEQTINEAAQLAASYSRAWKEMLSAINVYWVNPEQVSKSPPSGQFLKKGSFMIRGSKNFVRGVPLQVAIGIEIDNNEIIVVGGPVDAISNRTEVFVKIIPGNKKSSHLAKQIRHKLSEKVSEDLKRSITQIRLEEFQRNIPLGRGKID
jgi:predicted ribosome quality control (RQC) complex YloA/Tae2 family protein